MRQEKKIVPRQRAFLDGNAEGRVLSIQERMDLVMSKIKENRRIRNSTVYRFSPVLYIKLEPGSRDRTEPAESHQLKQEC